MNRGDIGQQGRMTAGFYRDQVAVWTELNLQVKDVGSLFAVEDEENLSGKALALDGLQGYDEVDAGFEKSEIVSGH